VNPGQAVDIPQNFFQFIFFTFLASESTKPVFRYRFSAFYGLALFVNGSCFDLIKTSRSAFAFFPESELNTF
jgi:hypothetical protein